MTRETISGYPGEIKLGLRAELVEHLVGRKVLDTDHEVLAQRAKFVRQPPIGCIRNHLDDVERPLKRRVTRIPTERDRLHGWAGRTRTQKCAYKLSTTYVLDLS